MNKINTKGYIDCLNSIAKTTISQYIMTENRRDAEILFYTNYGFIAKFGYVSRETINNILYDMEVIHNFYVDNVYKWQSYTDINNLELSELLKIIDDGLSNGFRFKVENHTIFFQEID